MLSHMSTSLIAVGAALPDDIHKGLAEIAKRNERSLSGEIRYVLTKHVEVDRARHPGTKITRVSGEDGS